jgi:general secretion pathway protein M
MIDNMKIWWRGHSAGERRIIAILGVAVALVFLWLGVWRPVTSGLDTGWDRHGAALDRYGSVRAKVEALSRRSAAIPAPGGRPSLEQLVGQTAAEAGFTLDRVAGQGDNRMSVNIASARMGPLLAWLSRLEQAGVAVQTISIVPGGTEGVVTVQAVLMEAAS